MSINITFQNINHPKYILNQLKTSNELPFKEILSASCATQNFNNNIPTRDRIFTPDLTMWGFYRRCLMMTNLAKPLLYQITIREVMIQKKRSGSRTQNCVIITTFLDCEKVCKKDLEELYDNRWHVELDLRAIKDTMNMGILLGKKRLWYVKKFGRMF